MKPDKQHIDDLFRESLSDFTKEPAHSSWKKISARLLWFEIAHFRFGNVPKFWYGIAAVGAIGISLLFTMVISDNTSEDITNSGNQQELVLEKAAPADPLTPNISPVASPNSIDEAEEKDQKEINLRNEESPITTPADGIGGKNEISATLENETQKVQGAILQSDSEKQLAISQTETGVFEQDVQTASNIEPDVEKTQKPAEAMADETATKNAAVRLFASEEESLPETQPSSEIISPVNRAEAAEIAVEMVPQPDLPVQETEVMAVAEATIMATDISAKEPVSESENIAFTISEPLLLNMRPGRVHLDKSAEADENTPSARANAIMLRSQTQSLGKVQKHNARNSLLSSLFRGEYKPPKRSFQDPILAMYGGPKPYYTLSAYFSPEVTEYQRLASESRESSYYGGLALSYNTSRFILQAGLEYSAFTDLGDYMVNMSTYDSVGFYHDVVGFEIDPNNPDSIIFETHTVAVWDSVQHHSHQQTNNRYTYLQVPLMIGYKAMQRGLFSAHIKAGPSFSFILNRQEPGLNFRMPGATINGIDNYTAPRLNTNIQLLVSVAFHLQFTEKFGLLVEPTYRYYVNPVYDINSDALKNPYGISVKTGLFYNF